MNKASAQNAGYFNYETREALLLAMIEIKSVTDTWRPKRPGPASDRDNVTRQTLRAGIRAPLPEKPYVNVIGGTGTLGIA